MNGGMQALMMATALGGSMGGFRVPYSPSNWKGGKSGNKGQAEAKKARNRRNNRLARKNRRLNLRRGKIAGK